MSREDKPGFNRRDVLKTLGLGTTAGLLGLIGKPDQRRRQRKKKKSQKTHTPKAWRPLP